MRTLQPTLPLQPKYNGLVNVGYQTQFNLLRQKLLTDSSNITIRTLGGSVTRGSAPSGVVAYPIWLQSYLNVIFKTDRFDVENLAHGGVHPFHAQCDILGTKLHADVYIIEYALNGWGPNHNWSYEGLIRTIRHADPDAVVICFGAFWWFNAGAPPGNLRPYDLSPILEEALIARHYGVAYISAREALYNSDKGQHWDWISGDGLHPNSLGQSYFASLIASFIFEQLATVAILQRDSEQLRTPLYSENQHHMTKCFQREALISLKESSSLASFEMHNDANNNGDMKEGLTSDTCEDWARFSLSANHLPDNGMLVFHVLKGWNNIANISLTCVEGCSCKSEEFDANFDHRPTTEIVPFFLPYTRQSNQSCLFLFKTLCTADHNTGNKTHQRIAAISVSDAVL